MKRLLLVWCASQLIACSAMELMPGQTSLHEERINRHAYQAATDWADNLDGVARLLDDAILIKSIEQQATDLDAHVQRNRYITYLAAGALITTGGIGAQQFIKNLRRPVKRDLYSFVAEKALSFVLLGSVFAAYKIKGLWDKREIGQIKSTLSELRAEIASLRSRSNQQEAALADAVDRITVNTQALKAASENFAAAQEHIDAIRAPVENVQTNQQAILAKVNGIVAKTEEYLHRREHKGKWAFF